MQKLLLAQFKETFTNPDWFVSFNGAIKGLESSRFSFKINDESNSIEQIVHHLIYWNNLYLQRYKNKSFHFSSIDNDATFNNAAHLDKDQAIEKIQAVFREMESILENATDVQLAELVGDSNVTWGSMFGKLILHNAYHIGQIVTIRKYNNCWIADWA